MDHFELMFNPETVAVVGASEVPGKGGWYLCSCFNSSHGEKDLPGKQ